MASGDDSLPAADLGSAQPAEPTLVRRVRVVGRILWMALAVAVAALLVRIAFMLRDGVDEFGASSHHIANLVYTVTDPLAQRFSAATFIQIPINGLPHVLDVESLVAIDGYFFGVLAFTKISLWAARWYVSRQESRRTRTAPTTLSVEQPVAEPAMTSEEPAISRRA